MNPLELTVSITALANTLACKLTVNQMKNGGLNILQVEIADLAAHNHKLVEIQLRLFEILPVQLPVAHQDNERAIDPFPQLWEFTGSHSKAKGHTSIYGHGNQGIP